MIDRLDSEAEGSVEVPRLCDTCVRQRTWNTCEAFPVHIPWAILWNRWNHHQPYPGDGDPESDDHGITFKSKPWDDEV